CTAWDPGYVYRGRGADGRPERAAHGDSAGGGDWYGQSRYAGARHTLVGDRPAAERCAQGGDGPPWRAGADYGRGGGGGRAGRAAQAQITAGQAQEDGRR